MKELVNNIKALIDDKGGILIRGYDGTDKLGLAYRFLADTFQVGDENVPQVVRDIDKWNLKRRKLEFLDQIKSERGGRGNNPDPRLTRRGNRSFPDMDPVLYKRFVGERLSDSDRYWDMIEDFDSHYIVTLGDMISLIPDKTFYLIVRQADYYSNQTLCLALQDRDTPFYDNKAGKIKVPQNLKVIAISSQYHSDKAVAELFHSVVVEIDEERVENPEKRKLMRIVNRLLNEEINNDIVKVGEKYFLGNEPVQQTVIDLEPILFDLIPRQVVQSDHQSVSGKEVYQRIIEKIKEEMNG